MSDGPISRRAFGQSIAAAAAGGMLQPMTVNAGLAGDDLCALTAVELAARIRAKQVSAREVMTAHLARIERINSQVNAIVTLVAERAMADAARADEALARGETPGPLHGLPVAHKDLVDTAGIRTTRGSPFFRDHVPTDDALIVTRIRAAGAVTLGKTNTPELGAGSQTFNTIFGATKNPYDLTRTCGGSSGGAAVSLACRMLPIADGSDTGGSLRNPAAFCNVVGFRPSPGRVPAESGSWSPLSVSGPMARTVADVALFLSAIAGPDARSPLALQDDGARFRAPLGRDFKGVRVAWWKGLGGIPVEPDVTRTVNANKPAFERLGCVVEEAEPDFSGVADAFPILRYASSYPQYSELAPARGLAEGHDPVRDRAGGAAHRRRRRARGRTPGPDVSAGARVLLTLRLLRAAGDASRALRRERAVPERSRRLADGDLHRLDAHVLVRHVHGHAGHLRAGRLHCRRTAGGSPDRRAAPRRLERAAARARVRTGHGSRNAPAAGR
jgi:Asp-tRNA(Asn)/Glu-tRNA(Gln) amidotransferase A subunit family amidase